MAEKGAVKPSREFFVDFASAVKSSEKFFAALAGAVKASEKFFAALAGAVKASEKFFELLAGAPEPSKELLRLFLRPDDERFLAPQTIFSTVGDGSQDPLRILPAAEDESELAV